ncbi:hypothetical protein D9601_17980 [Sphingomonas sp. MA1305]|uniref:hypothetical protein n=1 Tax=Sphingomonas sp. MA1305 TaxID=2479204 RepID=UPI0018DFA70C|nr:hypothetical protein [Sphingomonas sp. MA1305]MBI0477241.1 hypothetical protein [Sphingomonas sp. MA1305]
MRRIICALSLTSGLIAAAPAMAQSQMAQGQTAPTSVAQAATATPADPAAFTDDHVLTERDLGAIAGREDRGTQIAAADQRNTVANNSVTGNSVTGSVTIDGQAFSNLSGLAVISANSGNNVAINSAMNVVINLGPQ